MPVLRDVPLTLTIDQVLRREGAGGRSKFRRPEMKSLLGEMLASIEELHLLEPAIAYELHAITEVNRHRLCLEGGAVLHGWLLPSVLKSARELAVVVCTIGPKLEKKVTDYSAQKALLQAFLLDGIGSAAVDALVQKACHFMRHEALSRNYQASSPLNPGMPGLPISEQCQLFQLVPAGQIGVHLTSSAMMAPRKSVSMIMGIGPDMPTWTQEEVCKRCTVNKACPYRIDSQQPSWSMTIKGS